MILQRKSNFISTQRKWLMTGGLTVSMHFSQVSLNHSVQRLMPLFTTSVHSTLFITIWQGVYLHKNGAFLIETTKCGQISLPNYFKSSIKYHLSCPAMCASLTFTAPHGLCCVLLLCAVACSCKILTKGFIAILAHYFIPDALELFIYILCFFLELHTVSLK